MKILKKAWFKVIVIVISIILISACMFYIYVGDYYKSDEVAKRAMQGSDIVSAQEKENYWVFTLNGQESTKGYIFYPGGKVEETAYAPLMLSLAEKGITCIILKLPFHLAVLDQDSANYAINEFPNIQDWYVGGHSLGGVIAANYAASHEKMLKGIILMGAYSVKDLTNTNLQMLSFYGSRDGVLDFKSFERNKKNQPENTTYYEIQGGNHAYYGNYGEQKGDNNANISVEEQQKYVVDEICSWLNK